MYIAKNLIYFCEDSKYCFYFFKYQLFLDNEDGTGHVPHVQCPHCAYNTTSESRLNAHMATHYNLKIFKCPDCGKL